MKKARLRSQSSKDVVSILRRLIVAVPADDGSGFSWTLAAALGDMLNYAEEMFGARDHNWTLLGIDFTSAGGRIWMPGDCGHIIVQLDMNALMDRYDAYRQLAHESIHVLSPTGKADANVLEEGLAVYFEQWYMHHVFGTGWWSGQISLTDYARALSLVQQLLAIDPTIIRRIRRFQPVIAHFTVEDILGQCPTVPTDLARSLTERFTTV